MNCYISWIFLLVIQLFFVSSRSVYGNVPGHDTGQVFPYQPNNSNNRDSSPADNEQVISVRITSSIAVGRGNGKSTQITSEHTEPRTEFGLQVTTTTETTQTYHDEQKDKSYVPPNLEGANIEFIKQLNAKKDMNYPTNQMYPYQLSTQKHNNESDIEGMNYGTENYREYPNGGNTPITDNIPFSSQDLDFYKRIDEVEPSILNEALKYSEERLTSNATDDLILAKAETDASEMSTPSAIDYDQTDLNHDAYNETEDSIAESSIKSVLEITDKNDENYENIENVPLARSVIQSPSPKNFIQGLVNKLSSERESSTRLTTVSFNVVHDSPKAQNSFSDPTSQTFERQPKFYEPPKIYSQPAQIYSEPAKFYSEPAKIYSEPAKIYSEPAKVYSEPAKIYSEPAKFYSEPASLHLDQNVAPPRPPWQHSQAPPTTFNTTPLTTISLSDLISTPRIPEHQAEKNYEVDEKVSVLTHGRSHGVQETTTEKCKQDNCKVGYVVKGRQYNKYRVEERTSDGFIVGEYGVVRNEDGALRGVRYTADSDASPRLIYDALMKFLQLK